MDILNKIIQGLNKEDIRHFKLLAKRMRDHDNRKDIELFDYIRHSNEKYDDNKILKKLYSNNDKNSFYRLKNRLIQDINESLLLLHYRKDEIMYVLHLLSLVRFYFSKNRFLLALRFNKKAEDVADKIESYELLDIIYGEYIRLSHEVMSVDPENYINKRKDIREKLNSLRQIDDILATVTYRLKITQNFSEKGSTVLTLLESTINNFTNDKNVKKSPLLRFKMYRAVSQVLLQKHDFISLEKYLLTTYYSFLRENLFNRNNHDTKLQMLTYIVNSLFKNKKHKDSLKYVDQLKLAMDEYSGLLRDKYLFFYENSLVINYSVLDKDKAISILEDLKQSKKSKPASFYDIFIYLNLAVLWFDKKDFRNSIRNLNNLYHHEGYKNADQSLRFKIAVAELIIRYELGDFDTLDYRMLQLKSEYKKLMKKEEHKRDAELLVIIGKLIQTALPKSDKKLLKKMKIFVREHALEDTEIINYNHWLSSKM